MEELQMKIEYHLQLLVISCDHFEAHRLYSPQTYWVEVVNCRLSGDGSSRGFEGAMHVYLMGIDHCHKSRSMSEMVAGSRGEM